MGEALSVNTLMTKPEVCSGNSKWSRRIWRPNRDQPIVEDEMLREGRS